jgi:hypothetical protein
MEANVFLAEHGSVLLSLVGELAQHPGQVHFAVAALEATLCGSLDSALSFQIVHALAEEIGVAAEVLGRRKRDCIYAILDRDMPGRRKAGDAMSERADEIA